MTTATDRARQILAGNESASDAIRSLVAELKGELEFGLARKLLERARTERPEDAWIKQQLALCTYKDEELYPTTRFQRALSILEEIGLGSPSTTDPETLALGGAVHKRMWEQGGQLEHLYEALALYRAAYRVDPDEDKGYGGVNAAYILDILAARAGSIARRTGTDAPEGDELSAQAKALREDMATRVPPMADREPSLKDQYWFAVTLAEIYFGLEDWDRASGWLSRAGSLEAKEWERETTFRQLVSIARLKGITPSPEGTDASGWHPAWQALARMLGTEATERALSCYRGKVGLALSGGGLRASFFHLGVLARLAELDALRSVDVLSTVSGGSIVGVHYYLEVQRLLATKADKDIAAEDYLEIVQRIQGAFLDATRANLRVRALSSLGPNLRMIFSQRYSRSHRMGQLYEQYLYGNVPRPDGTTRPRTMQDLLVLPADEPESDVFKPKFSNWRRRARVPVLLINTTSLNSGHNWHFTATWMGEPPGVQGEDVDRNRRYRRLYYSQAPAPPLREYPLGYAVAASSCVPGLFEPLVLDGLYEAHTVRLVDGGVHDNQGVRGLLDEGCTTILCSDASGQMDDKPNPADSLLAVPLRSNSVLMDRVREAEYQDLKARVDSRTLQGLFFVHLKQDLPAWPVDWVDCQDPTAEAKNADMVTKYGIACDLQEKLAHLRTDLDAFTDVEAYSLMLSGYLITERQFRDLQEVHEKSGEPGTWGGFDVAAPRTTEWPFLAIETVLSQRPEKGDAARQDLARQLDVGAQLFFKIWRLDTSLRRFVWQGATIAVLALIAALYWYWDTPVSSFTVGDMAVVLVLALAALIVPALRWLNPREAARGYLGKAALGLLGYVGANIHLRFFNGRFLKRGELQRLLSLVGKEARR